MAPLMYDVHWHQRGGKIDIPGEKNHTYQFDYQLEGGWPI